MRPRIPVVELLRVSTAEQADDDRGGLPRQQEANRRTIERHNLNVVGQVRLVDVSGACTQDAPEIQEMLRMIRTGQAHGLVLADLDRLLRPDDWNTFSILQPFKDAGAQIYLPDQVLDLNTQAGFLMSGIQSVIAGNELAQFKKRVHGAKEEKRKQGKCPQSYICLPTGVNYDRTTETWGYTEDAVRVREIFGIFLAGEHNLREIQRQTGIHHQTVKNLLRNQLYIGKRVYDSKRSTERRIGLDGRQTDRRKVARAEADIISVQVIQEPLIDPAQFWRVQELLASKRDGFTERRKDSDGLFMFKGMLRCEVCGEPMYTVPGGKAGTQKDYYYCRRKSSHFRVSTGGCSSGYMRRGPVEDAVLEFIGQRLADKDFIFRHVAQLFKGGDAKNAAQAREDIMTALGRLDKMRQRAIELYTDGVTERSEMDAKLAHTTREKSRLESKLAGITAPLGLTLDDLSDVAERAARGFALFPFWDSEDQRKYLRVENPNFWIGPSGISRFSLPVGMNMSAHTGRDSWPPRA